MYFQKNQMPGGGGGIRFKLECFFSNDFLVILNILSSVDNA